MFFAKSWPRAETHSKKEATLSSVTQGKLGGVATLFTLVTNSQKCKRLIILIESASTVNI